jgi:hypothetical protein|nr:MAG TPA: hypothetical protein [Caudoviricetes sp.]
MTPKEAATATVEKFFELLGYNVQVNDYWESHGGIDCIVHDYQLHDYQGPYTIVGSSFEGSQDTISVNVYNLEDDAKRDHVLRVSRVTPELAAKFTREAINAYEQELAE